MAFILRQNQIYHGCSANWLTKWKTSLGTTCYLCRYVNKDFSLDGMKWKRKKSNCSVGFSDLLGASKAEKFWLQNLFWARFTTFLATRKPWEKASLVYWWLLDIIPPPKETSYDVKRLLKIAKCWFRQTIVWLFYVSKFFVWKLSEICF